MAISRTSTPLSGAFAHEHFDVALMLLKRGANRLR